MTLFPVGFRCLLSSSSTETRGSVSVFHFLPLNLTVLPLGSVSAMALTCFSELLGFGEYIGLSGFSEFGLSGSREQIGFS